MYPTPTLMFSWQQIAQKGIFSVLAPMEEVSDSAFRQLLIEIGRPDVFFTEFTSLDGAFSKGSDIVLQRFEFKQNELPLIAQVWGKDESLFSKGMELVIQKGFSGMDINMGCPDKDVVKNKAGAYLICDMDKTEKIIVNARSYKSNFPLSIKTRIGFDEIDLNWFSYIFSFKPNAVSIHLRTAKEKTNGEPHYELMPVISKLRDNISPDTVLICNGDIKSIEQGEKLCSDNGFQGYMIGREAVNNPYVFKGLTREYLTKENRIKLALRHTEIFKDIWDKRKNFNILKKFYARYITNFEGCINMKTKLMGVKSYDEALKILS